MINKLLIDNLVKRGAIVHRLSDTNFYRVEYKKKIFNFIGNYTPVTPYVYGMFLSDNKNIKNLLKTDHIKIKKMDATDNKSYRACITKDGYCNILLRNFPQIVGDGFSTLRELLAKENLRRINNPDSKILPIKIDEYVVGKIGLTLSYIPKVGEKIVLGSITNLEEGATFVDVTVSMGKFVVVLAKRILNLFPGLCYLSFDFYSNGAIRNVDLSLIPNIFFMMKKEAHNRKAVEVISDLIIESH